MAKIKLGDCSMIDSFDKLVNICINNDLGEQTVDYLVDIKKALEEKEKLEQALDRSCFELMYYQERLYTLEKNITELGNCYCIKQNIEPKNAWEWKELLLHE